MDIIKKDKPLIEVRKRIKALLANIESADCKIDGAIFNDGHTIHIKLQNHDYVLSGTITKRVAHLKIV